MATSALQFSHVTWDMKTLSQLLTSTSTIPQGDYLCIIERKRLWKKYIR